MEKSLMKIYPNNTRMAQEDDLLMDIMMEAADNDFCEETYLYFWTPDAGVNTNEKISALAMKFGYNVDCLDVSYYGEKAYRVAKSQKSKLKTKGFRPCLMINESPYAESLLALRNDEIKALLTSKGVDLVNGAWKRI
jgi:hypothetical protein